MKLVEYRSIGDFLSINGKIHLTSISGAVKIKIASKRNLSSQRCCSLIVKKSSATRTETYDFTGMQRSTRNHIFPMVFSTISLQGAGVIIHCDAVSIDLGIFPFGTPLTVPPITSPLDIVARLDESREAKWQEDVQRDALKVDPYDTRHTSILDHLHSSSNRKSLRKVANAKLRTDRFVRFRRYIGSLEWNNWSELGN